MGNLSDLNSIDFLKKGKVSNPMIDIDILFVNSDRDMRLYIVCFLYYLVCSLEFTKIFWKIKKKKSTQTKSYQNKIPSTT